MSSNQLDCDVSKIIIDDELDQPKDGRIGWVDTRQFRSPKHTLDIGETEGMGEKTNHINCKANLCILLVLGDSFLWHHF